MFFKKLSIFSLLFILLHVSCNAGIVDYVSDTLSLAKSAALFHARLNSHRFSCNKVANDKPTGKKYDVVWVDIHKDGSIKSLHDGKKTPLVLGSIPREQKDIEYLKKYIGCSHAKNVGIYSIVRPFERDWSGLSYLLEHNPSYKLFAYPTTDYTAPTLSTLKHAVNALHKRDKQNVEVAYIHCKSGIGRSATVVAAYILDLLHKHGITTSVARVEEYIQRCRPQVKLSDTQKNVLLMFQKQVHGLDVKVPDESNKNVLSYMFDRKNIGKYIAGLAAIGVGYLIYHNQTQQYDNADACLNVEHNTMSQLKMHSVSPIPNTASPEIMIQPENNCTPNEHIELNEFNAQGNDSYDKNISSVHITEKNVDCVIGKSHVETIKKGEISPSQKAVIGKKIELTHYNPHPKKFKTETISLSHHAHKSLYPDNVRKHPKYKHLIRLQNMLVALLPGIQNLLHEVKEGRISSTVKQQFTSYFNGVHEYYNLVKEMNTYPNAVLHEQNKKIIVTLQQILQKKPAIKNEIIKNVEILQLGAQPLRVPQPVPSVHEKPQKAQEFTHPHPEFENAIVLPKSESHFAAVPLTKDVIDQRLTKDLIPQLSIKHALQEIVNLKKTFTEVIKSNDLHILQTFKNHLPKKETLELYIHLVLAQVKISSVDHLNKNQRIEYLQGFLLEVLGAHGLFQKLETKIVALQK